MDTIAIAGNATQDAGSPIGATSRPATGLEFIVLAVASLSVANTLSLISGFGGVSTQWRVINWSAAWTLAAMPLLLWTWRACTRGFAGRPMARIAFGVIGCISTVAVSVSLSGMLVAPLVPRLWYEPVAVPPWLPLAPLLSVVLLLLAWLSRGLTFGRGVRLVAWAAAWFCTVAFTTQALLFHVMPTWTW